MESEQQALADKIASLLVTDGEVTVISQTSDEGSAYGVTVQTESEAKYFIRIETVPA